MTMEGSAHALPSSRWKYLAEVSGEGGGGEGGSPGGLGGAFGGVEGGAWQQPQVMQHACLASRPKLVAPQLPHELLAL